ncbi:MAG: SMI1/KNR4 family protein [Saprospiraceae bacterium]
MKWKEPLSDEFIEEILKKFRIKLPNDYITFLKTHRRIDSEGVIELKIYLKGKPRSIGIEPTYFNAIEFFEANTYLKHDPEIKKNDLVAICKGVDGEILLIGASDDNLGKIYYCENDLSEFYLVADSFTEFKATIAHLID